MPRGVNEPAGDITHVVYAWPHRTCGGSQRYLLTLMRALAGTLPMTAILPSGSDASLVGELAQLGVRTVFLPSALPTESPRSFSMRVRGHVTSWIVSWHLWRACRSLQAAGTLFHLDVFPPIQTGPLLLLASRSPVVVTLHTRVPPLSGARSAAWRLRFALLRRCRGLTLVTSNADVRQSLSPYVPSRDIGRVALAYSPVDRHEIAGVLEATSRDGVRSALGLAPTDVLVVTGAQWIARKGPDTWRRAAVLVRRLIPEAHFIWVAPSRGDEGGSTDGGDERIRVMTQEDLGGTRRDYLGVVAAADLFVLPSREDGLPMAIVEAMALGLPVVSTSVNGIPEAVIHGVTGALVPPDDPERLAVAVLELLRNPALRASMRAAALQHVATFDSAHMVTETLAAYAGAARRARHPA